MHGAHTHTSLSHTHTLSLSVSLAGAIINLFTPCPDFTDEHTAFIESVPTYQKELVSVIKQYYKPEWKDTWR